MTYELTYLLSLLTFLLTLRTSYLLTYCMEQSPDLTCLELVKNFPVFCRNRRFITAFTSARHLSLYWARSIQSIPPHLTSWRSNLILSSHLRLGLPTGFPSTCNWTKDQWSARRRDLYLTTHNTHKQTSMPLVGFEPTISVSERLQLYLGHCDRQMFLASCYCQTSG